MLCPNSGAAQQVSSFYTDRVQAGRAETKKAMQDIVRLVQEVLIDVESQEPRFISTLTETNGHYEGLRVASPYEYEVILYLNQMGVFNFVDDSSIPGCAVLKLSDGRKRSMSLWVEFITASGYLSARKIRNRFQALVAQTLEKPKFADNCKLLSDSSDVRICVYGKFVVQVTCAFRCNGIWPRSASQWPTVMNWPNAEMIKEVRCKGFDLLSKEMSSPSQQQQQQQQTQSQVNKQAGGGSSLEADAWAMCMHQVEDILLSHVNRKKVLSILKTLRDRHLNYMGSPISNYILRTLVLFECEKHPVDQEWSDYSLSDRIIGILLQLISCLQCRKCPHYFLPQLDLVRGKSAQVLDHGSRAVWSLLRQMLLNPRALELL